VLKSELCRECFFLVTTFLELPLTVYMEWYIHSQVITALEKTGRKAKATDLEGNYRIKKGLRVISTMMDEASKMTDKTTTALR